MLRFASTYLGLGSPCRWLRGNHHGHSTVSDGSDEPRAIAAAYEAEGYDYIALSEHDRLLSPDELQGHTSMCVVPAIEVTSRYGQSLMYLGAQGEMPAGELTPRQIMDRVHGAGGLFVFDHPNWRPRPDYATDELLDTMEGMRGMEIYCGVIERLPGQARATDRWERLLSKGWRVYGHGTDDQHEQRDHFVAWNCVQWPEGERPSAAGIVEALREGRFYASTGSVIHILGTGEEANSVQVASDADEIHWIGPGGVIIKKENGGTSRLTVEEFADLTGGEPAAEGEYVRAECLGRGNRSAWTQPFWVV